MARGGRREGAGRPRGTPNKANAERQAEIAASGVTPLEYMLDVLRNPNADEKRRDWAAKEAAPYVHPKLAATELTGKDGGPIQTEDMTDTETARRLAFALTKGAVGLARKDH